MNAGRRTDPALAALLERWGVIADLGYSQALLAWDERTMMPASGAAARAELVATLAGLQHRQLVDEELWELVQGLAAEHGAADTIEAASVRVALRECGRARQVPTELRAELARAGSLGESAWAAARAGSDLGAYLPQLERNIELRRRYADCFAPFEHPYDALLADFEPGLSTSEARRILAELRAGLVPLAAAVAERPDAVDDSILRGEFDPDVQAGLLSGLLAELPLPAGAWRLDPTVHPFAAAVGAGDLRLTTRFDPADISFGLFSALHEAGHGMYEAGVPAELRRGPIGSPSSLAFHESQSRLWENWVGRSRPYLARALPALRRAFPSRFGEVDAERLYRAANRARPSLIRVEADEVTYNLHIALRFELELELFEGTLEASDLADAWAERTRQLLGLEVPDHAHGVMQDVHWAAGSFGYFPTYSLGNVIAAQLWEAAEAELGDPELLVAEGELKTLGGWLRERVHRHGGRYPLDEMAERALGGPLDPAALIRRLERKFGELYSF